MDSVETTLKGVEKKCEAEDCTGRHYAKGWCKRHYAQVLRHGKLTPDRERGAIRVCKAEGCGRQDTIHWYCRKHARQLRVHGRLTPEREHVIGVAGCLEEGCKLPHRAKGFCAKHYNKDRWLKQKTQKAEKAAKPKTKKPKKRSS